MLQRVTLSAALAAAAFGCASEVMVVGPPDPERPPLEPAELPRDPCRDAWIDSKSCCSEFNCAWLPEGSSGVCVSWEDMLPTGP